MTTYGLVVSFEGLHSADAMPTFVFGFEAGQLWTRMKAGTEAEIVVTVHSANRELIERMAAADGWDAALEDVHDESGAAMPEWLSLTLTKARLAAPNPRGLRVVKRET